MKLLIRDNTKKKQIEIYRKHFGIYRQVWFLYSYYQNGKGGAYTRETALKRAVYCKDNLPSENLEAAYKFRRDNDKASTRRRYQFQLLPKYSDGMLSIIFNIRRASAGAKGSIFPYSKQIGIYKKVNVRLRRGAI